MKVKDINDEEIVLYIFNGWVFRPKCIEVKAISVLVDYTNCHDQLITKIEIIENNKPKIYYPYINKIGILHDYTQSINQDCKENFIFDFGGDILIKKLRIKLL